MNRTAIVALLLAFCALVMAPAAFATTVCVGTTSGLRNALDTWQTASDQT